MLISDSGQQHLPVIRTGAIPPGNQDAGILYPLHRLGSLLQVRVNMATGGGIIHVNTCLLEQTCTNV